MELEPLTPEEFLERLGIAEEDAFSFVKRGHWYERTALREEHGFGTSYEKALKDLPLIPEDYIRDCVYERAEFARHCKHSHDHNLLPMYGWPLVDKHLNLVFNLQDGGHGVLMANLYNLHAGADHLPVPLSGDARILSMYGMPGLAGDRLDPAREYIVQGYGYVISSVSGMVLHSRPAFAISKKLFDSEALDEHDEAILKNREIRIAEDFFV